MISRRVVHINTLKALSFSNVESSGRYNVLITKDVQEEDLVSSNWRSVLIAKKIKIKEKWKFSQIGIFSS